MEDLRKDKKVLKKQETKSLTEDTNIYALMSNLFM